MARRRTRYIPAQPFNVPMCLLAPTVTTVKGVKKLTYPDPKDGVRFNGSFRTFGGTESTENNLYTVVDTATIDTWYRPDIKADCRIYLYETGATYEVKGSPEDIDMRHQFLKIRVQRIGGAT